MSREQIIEQVMNEFGKMGLTKDIVEGLYDSGIEIGIAEEVIYPGMRYLCSVMCGADRVGVADDVAKAFLEHATNDRVQANAPTSEKKIKRVLANEAANMTEDECKALSESLQNDIADAVNKVTKQFVEEYADTNTKLDK